jgi:hypothetical protein
MLQQKAKKVPKCNGKDSEAFPAISHWVYAITTGTTFLVISCQQYMSQSLPSPYWHGKQH